MAIVVIEDHMLNWHSCQMLSSWNKVIIIIIIIIIDYVDALADTSLRERL